MAHLNQLKKNSLRLPLLFVALSLIGSATATAACPNGQWCDEFDTYVMDAIDNFGMQDIFFKDAADSAEDFCSNFSHLSATTKKKFWAKFMQALSRTETEASIGMWDQYSRYKEPGANMAHDGVTGTRVYSEGLMQISYQDGPQHGCSPEKLGWERDRHLSATDHSKTIFNAKVNLECGVHILANQLRHSGKIITKNSAWHPLHGKGDDYKRLKSNWKALKKKGLLDFCE